MSVVQFTVHTNCHTQKTVTLMHPFIFPALLSHHGLGLFDWQTKKIHSLAHDDAVHGGGVLGGAAQRAQLVLRHSGGERGGGWGDARQQGGMGEEHAQAQRSWRVKKGLPA